MSRRAHSRFSSMVIAAVAVTVAGSGAVGAVGGQVAHAGQAPASAGVTALRTGGALATSPSQLVAAGQRMSIDLAARAKPRPKATSGKKAPSKRVRATQGKVAYLTFDDGPNRQYTPAILSLLAKHNAKATFFMIGSQARSNPALVRQARAKGHAVGNHTQTHPWLTRISLLQVSNQLRQADASLGRTTCMRPPGGFVNGGVRAAARAQGKSVIMWDVDPADWRRPGAASITNTIVKRTRPGSVILMHDGGGNRGQSVAALAQVLPRLKAQGYRFEALPACR